MKSSEKKWSPHKDVDKKATKMTGESEFAQNETANERVILNRKGIHQPIHTPRRVEVISTKLTVK